MVKREKYDHLHLVCHFAIPLKASLSHFWKIIQNINIIPGQMPVQYISFIIPLQKD